MVSIMDRSFAESNGLNWPKEVASIVNGHVVTYADLLQERKERQARHLEMILGFNGPSRRAAHVWTFFVPGWLYGGWHLYLRTLKQDWWLRADSINQELIFEIRRLFPCGLLPIAENFYEWTEAFAKAYSRPGRFERQGIRPVWLETDGSGNPISIKAI